MKHINDNVRKYPSHSDDRFVLSRRIIIKANGIFSELKELKHLYPDHWMLREDEEVREWHENEPYKAIWSHVQFLVRMGHLVTQSAMFHLLNMAVEYPFDAEEATTLVEWEDAATAIGPLHFTCPQIRKRKQMFQHGSL